MKRSIVEGIYNSDNIVSFFLIGLIISTAVLWIQIHWIWIRIQDFGPIWIRFQFRIRIQGYRYTINFERKNLKKS